MSGFFADFGNLEYVPRLKRLLPKIFKKFENFHLSGEVSEYDTKHGHFFEMINGFTIARFEKIYEDEDDEETVKKFEFSLQNNYISFQLFSLQYDINETFASERYLEHVVDNIIKKVLDLKQEYGNLRRIPLCFCKIWKTSGKKKYCENCLDKCTFREDTCAICLDDELQVARWVETPCKHVFHKHCLDKVPCLQDERGKKCPLCRSKFAYASGTYEREL